MKGRMLATDESEVSMLRKIGLILVALCCLLVPAVVLADKHDPKRIMPAEVMARLSAGENIAILDTRTTADWTTGTRLIANAQRVKNNETLNRIVRKIPLDRLIVTYCT